VRLVALGFLASGASAKPSNAFFAMDTIARGGPDVVPALLAELGYDGIGGKALDVAMPPAMRAQKLKFYNGYLTLTVTPASVVPDEKLRAWFAAMKGYDTALWLAIKSVARPDGTSWANSAAEADEVVVAHLRRLAGAAAPHGVRLALYPHAAQWLERVEDAIRVVGKVDRANVGLTFNLAHWLRVEGDQRDPRPVLKAALPRLMFVTINGADAGETKTMAWTRLIQPLDAGTYDVAKFVRLLGEVKYTGPVGFQGYGIKAEPRGILERSMIAWKGFAPGGDRSDGK